MSILIFKRKLNLSVAKGLITKENISVGKFYSGPLFGIILKFILRFSWMSIIYIMIFLFVPLLHQTLPVSCLQSTHSQIHDQELTFNYPSHMYIYMHIITQMCHLLFSFSAVHVCLGIIPWNVSWPKKTDSPLSEFIDCL